MFPANNLQQYFDELAEQDWTLIPVDLAQALKLRKSAEDKFKAQKFKPATLNRSLTPEKSIRNDSIFWLGESSDLINADDKTALEQINLLTSELKEYFRTSLNSSECHYAVYEAGHFYHRHQDLTANNNKRVFSFVVYLNESWNSDDGGQLVGYSGLEKVFTIEPQMGQMILFKSELEHEVLKTNKARYSLTGWLRK
ncbi:MAG: 2OG-Fe(II) oxygenase [Pseudobdellovibrio sp.]